MMQHIHLSTGCIDRENLAEALLGWLWVSHWWLLSAIASAIKGKVCQTAARR
jgi:hypothetical protein